MPRWRGAAPIQAAILAGDPVSGITVMQMDAGLDTGPMLLRAEIPITPRMTAGELHDALAALGPDLVRQVLDAEPSPVPQPAAGATYAPKLTRESGRIDWTLDVEVIDRQVRGLNPWPGTFTALGADILKIHAAEPVPGGGAPGTVVDDRLTVACGSGALRLQRVQVPGRAAMDAASFLRGHPIGPGTRLG